MVHELAHEMLHHGGAERPSKVIRETQAVAFVVSHGVGLETNRAAADYIALYYGDKKTLSDSLSEIQEAATTILNDLLGDERRTPEAAQERRQITPEPPPPTPEEPVLDR